MQSSTPSRSSAATAFRSGSRAATAAALHVPTAVSDLATMEHFALSDFLVGLAGLEGRPSPGNSFIAGVAGMIGLREDIVRHIPLHLELTRSGCRRVVVIERVVNHGAVIGASPLRRIAPDGNT